LTKPKTSDIDYLHISARLKAMERNLLNREKLLRMIAAKSGEDAVKVLTENGWGEFDAGDLSALEEQIEFQRKDTFELLSRYVPLPGIIDAFRLRYDYHNLKTIVKASALGEQEENILSDAGCIPAAKLRTIFREKLYHELEPVMRSGLVQAVDLLARTGDPQLSDVLLDRAMFEQMQCIAEQTGSDFLMGYIRLLIDLANLRVAVRAASAGKGFDYLRRAIIPGGSILPDRLYDDITGDFISQVFVGEYLSAPAAAGVAALSGGGMAGLDLACDDALMRYLRSARLIPFGEAGVISYLLARESEFTAVRTVMSGRAGGLGEEQISERLRMSYV
jgi:V/A-type H+-transporting ATPase subunit C